MGLWDDLGALFRRGRDKAATEAAKVAAKQAADRAAAQVEKAGEELLGFGERELEAAKKAREGRAEYTPSRQDADAIAAQVEAAAAAAREGTREALKGGGAVEADNPEARARAELERLKALRKKPDPPAG